MKINIKGAGVGGSLLANLLIDEGLNVTLIDIKESYYKPCGDVVPTSYNPPYKWNILNEVIHFKFIVNNSTINEVSYRRPKWVVIDKKGWIDWLRNRFIRRGGNCVVSQNYWIGQEGNFTVFANGPYNMDRKVVYTTRAIIEGESVEGAVLEFNTKLTGFYWIFPDTDNSVNVGAGFLEFPNSRDLLLKYISTKIKRGKIIDIRGAPISISKPKKVEFSIGEAAGLVFPLSGEGIRPAAISAEEYFKYIKLKRTLPESIYAIGSKEINSLLRKINIQRKLLEFYLRLNEERRFTFLRTLLNNEVLIDSYLGDETDYRGILESIKAIKTLSYDRNREI
jgi:Dehydrogenases (flavoproteins)